MDIPKSNRERRRLFALADAIHSHNRKELSSTIVGRDLYSVQKDLRRLSLELHNLEKKELAFIADNGDTEYTLEVSSQLKDQFIPKRKIMYQILDNINTTIYKAKSQIGNHLNSRDLHNQFNQVLRTATSKQVLNDILKLDIMLDNVRFHLRYKYIEGVTKEDIVLHDMHGIAHNLGKFIIRYNFSRANAEEAIRIFATSPEQHAIETPAVIHPHVKYNNLCMGNYSPTVTKLIRYGQTFSLFEIVSNMLSTYNSGSPYIRLEDWEGTECEHCGRVTRKTETCPDCEETICDECYTICYSCENRVCLSCICAANAKEVGFDTTSTAHICNYCIDNLNYCTDCHHLTTTKYQNKCPCCNGVTCDACWNSGSNGLCCSCVEQDAPEFGPIYTKSEVDKRIIISNTTSLSGTIIIERTVQASCTTCSRTHGGRISCTVCNNSVCNNCRIRCTACRTFACINCLEPVGPEGDLFCLNCKDEALARLERGAS